MPTPADPPPVITTGNQPLERILSGQSLVAALSEAETLEPPSASDAIKNLAVSSLAVTPGAFDVWYRRAWWGLIANRMLKLALEDGRHSEVVDIVRVPRLDQAKPHVFAGAHVGPTRVCRTILSRERSDIFCLTAGDAVGAEEVLDVTSDFGRLTAAAAVMGALKTDRDVFFALDGHYGVDVSRQEFLGRPVTLRSSVPRLISTVGVKSSLILALWSDRELVLSVDALPGIDATNRRGSIDDWYRAAINILEDACRSDPANLTFRSGFWRPGAEGVFAD